MAFNLGIRDDGDNESLPCTSDAPPWRRLYIWRPLRTNITRCRQRLNIILRAYKQARLTHRTKFDWEATAGVVE